jgi:hypothetical protein
MNLDEAQRRKVAEWIAQGLKLSEIQTRLASELGIKLTYMEARLLVDDLKLMPADSEPAKASPTLAPANPPGKADSAAPPAADQAEAEPPKSGGVSVTVDQLARAGALVSGKVTFSDGQKAEWYLDQSGRLGLASQNKGYRPSQADVQEFQAALDAELSKIGF